MNVTDKPLAANGFSSYRYKGRYGWIMIGATSISDALNEAQRSTHDKVSLTGLQVYKVEAGCYVDIA
jgi:hypothetical protein